VYLVWGWGREVLEREAKRKKDLRTSQGGQGKEESVLGRYRKTINNSHAPYKYKANK
jgi:hypothetical protein